MSRLDFDVVKLKGNENYHTWKFAMMNYLEFKELDKTIESEEAETNAKKRLRANHF